MGWPMYIGSAASSTRTTGDAKLCWDSRRMAKVHSSTLQLIVEHVERLILEDRAWWCDPEKKAG